MKNSNNLLVDVVALLVYLVVANPTITGLGIHEWLSIGVLVVFSIHLVAHYDWVIATLKTTLKNPSWAATGNLVLNIVILFFFCLDVVSGIMLSRFILPTFDLFSDGYFIWKPIHALSSKMLLALIILHVIVHWKWFVGLFTRRSK